MPQDTLHHGDASHHLDRRSHLDKIHPLDKLWLCRSVCDEDIDRVAEEAGISRLLATILLGRGMSDPEGIKEFMDPRMDGLNDPFLFNGMDRATERIIKAVKANERIVIYGDYDVDGITSTALLYGFLSELGSNVEYYIPDRIEDGYGLSINALHRIRLAGSCLIITVDCGITAVDEVKYINENGMEIIITDHHECKEILPEAFEIISSGIPGSRYPFKELAGVGVAYKLACAIAAKMGLDTDCSNFLDLTALGTVADVVSLTGENRIIVKNGIDIIQSTRRPGLRALLDNCGLQGKPVTSWVISFVLAPRINAAGRVGKASRAVRLFTTADAQEALSIVLQLNEENRLRQETETGILRQAIEIVEREIDLKTEKVIVICGKGWHHGVIGIVASRITDRYYRPCILISCEEDGAAKGSGRSVQGFDLFRALGSCGHLLEKYGGHEMAAGLSLRAENIPAVRREINIYADEVMEERDLIPKITIDAVIKREDISLARVRELEKLAPFGAGNPSPVFEYDALTVAEARAVGESKHLKLKLEDGGSFIDAIGFNMGNLLEGVNNGSRVDVACSLDVNSWNSEERVQMNIKGIKQCSRIFEEESYFISLDECMRFWSLSEYGGPEAFNFCYRGVEALQDMLQTEKNTVIMVNSLPDAQCLVKFLINNETAIKKNRIICYTSVDCNNFTSNSNFILVNPDPRRLELSWFDNAAIYGSWIDEGYLRAVIEKGGEDKLRLVKSGETPEFNIEQIVPEREELAAVYQYLKAGASEGKAVGSFSRLAEKVAYCYNININYFKIKRCVEIFEELKLIKKDMRKDGGVAFTVIYSGKDKKRLEDSKLYRMLQSLKMRWQQV
ncbi:exonuclease RecJ [Anaerobacterium chartisolvens]|uniref:Single-stranded-DNA-specific exonuclease RecJ n=1 Tax=Anaerobacterium chartisolvens TaxID=1297424 RepID=A0A369B8U7_9FIRM|nr:single-stranded-DNA-specific exonuclease RecJ [Anaerobacterium chartisolvens]RCX17959.1 exonuclease RecJ [Anaerobacterium chartisolvens]